MKDLLVFLLLVSIGALCIRLMQLRTSRWAESLVQHVEERRQERIRRQKARTREILSTYRPATLEDMQRDILLRHRELTRSYPGRTPIDLSNIRN